MVRTIDGKKKPFGDPIVWTPKKISSKDMKLSVDEIIAHSNDDAVASGVDLEVLEPYRRGEIDPKLNEIGLKILNQTIPNLIDMKEKLLDRDKKLGERVALSIRTGDKSASKVLSIESADVRQTIRSIDEIVEKLQFVKGNVQKSNLKQLLEVKKIVKQLEHQGHVIFYGGKRNWWEGSPLDQMEDEMIGYEKQSRESRVTKYQIDKILREAKDRADND